MNSARIEQPQARNAIRKKARAQEEISELKMLVDLYEDQLAKLRAAGQSRLNDH